MLRLDLATVVVRLIGAWLAFGIIQSAPAYFIPDDSGMFTGWILWFPMAFGLAALTLAAVLWFRAERIAAKLLPTGGTAITGSASEQQAIAPAMLLSVGLALMGVWFLAGGLIDLGYWWVRLEVRRRMSFPPDFPWSPERIATAVSIGVQIMLAFSLILGSGGLTRLLFLLRYGPGADRLANKNQ